MVINSEVLIFTSRTMILGVGTSTYCVAIGREVYFNVIDRRIQYKFEEGSGNYKLLYYIYIIHHAHTSDEATEAVRRDGLPSSYRGKP